MYDVLIVDDEPVARQSLRYLVDWEELGFAVRDEAQDGRQALELLKSRHYALVLTDIRMPIMNGLEMTAALREFADTPVVILSGYDDFAYAREGLKLGVKDYLLKPVDEDELAALLNKLAAELRERQLLERRQRLSHSAGRDRLLRRLAHGRTAPGEFAELFAESGLKPGLERYACLLAELDFMADGDLSDRDAELKRFAVRNIAEELCEGCGAVYEESEERIGLLLGGPAERMAADALRAFAERLIAAVRQYAKETITVGVGRPVDSAQAAAASRLEAERALDGKFLSGSGAALEARTEGCVADGGLGEVRALEADVLDAVRHGRRADAMRALGKLWDAFKREAAPAQRVRAAALELLVHLFRVVKEQGVRHEDLFDPSLGDYEKVMRSRTMDELLSLVERKCADVLEALRIARELRPNKVMEDVKRIVQTQYGGPISLRSVARQIYMNPNYLGKLFKANMQMPFNDYVLQVRMERAKQLLLTTDKKVYEIAQEVGFGELDWFYKRFKAYAGVSASEFRSAR